MQKRFFNTKTRKYLNYFSFLLYFTYELKVIIMTREEFIEYVEKHPLPAYVKFKGYDIEVEFDECFVNIASVSQYRVTVYQPIKNKILKCITENSSSAGINLLLDSIYTKPYDSKCIESINVEDAYKVIAETIDITIDCIKTAKKLKIINNFKNI